MIESYLKSSLTEMLYELQSNRLEVILVPQEEPVNCGACIRVPKRMNCEWYREFCECFPGKPKKNSRKLNTKIRRKETIRLLKRLISGQEVKSKYKDYLLAEAEQKLELFCKER